MTTLRKMSLLSKLKRNKVEIVPKDDPIPKNVMEVPKDPEPPRSFDEEKVKNFKKSLEYAREEGVKTYRFKCKHNHYVCPICGELDGKVFELKYAQMGVNYPPMHSECHCFVIEDRYEPTEPGVVYDDPTGEWLEVPPDFSYAQWFYLIGPGREDGVPYKKRKVKPAYIPPRPENPVERKVVPKPTYDYGPSTITLDVSFENGEVSVKERK